MRLDFIADGCGEAPLIRIFEFSADEVRQLHAAFLQMSDGLTEKFALHEQNWITTISNCELWLVFDKKDDKGVQKSGATTFVCTYSQEGWLGLADKTAPFIDGRKSGHYNWLTNEGDIEFLLSPDGRW